jgi:PIN domain nuclease of toxin-antitoxin system
MRLLLDTNILIHVARRQLDARIGAALDLPDNISFASAASLWEIAIKTRLGKLDPGLGLDDLPGYYESIGLTLLAVDHRHAVRWVDPEPATRDPFDRLLLAQCAVEDLRLVTLDRALARHPLAWRAS